MFRRYVQRPLTCLAAWSAAGGLLRQAHFSVLRRSTFWARRPRGETKPGSDFKYDTFMGSGVPSTIVKAVCDVRTKKNVVAAAFS
jgi:hypothetical protein